MLEAIFKLLKLEMQIAVAVVTLVSGAILWLLRPLVRWMWNALTHSKAQPVPEQQDTGVPVARTPAPAARPVSPPPVVVVQAPPQAPQAPSLSNAQRILQRPDHALYIATSSEWIIVHPRSDDLLEMVDRMGVVALHRDGDPFLEAAPDTSAPGGPDKLAPMKEDSALMEETAIVSVPAPDGMTWLRRRSGFFCLNA